MRPPPSVDWDHAWQFARSTHEDFSLWPQGFAGKWCIFRGTHVIDDAWRLVEKAVSVNRLQLAKVSTVLSRRDKHVICVYTRDWRDDADVNRARIVLLEIGFGDELGYKRDVETRAGVYGNEFEWYRRR